MHDLEFRIKFCFCAGFLASDRVTFESNCMKTDKDRHILSVAQIFGSDSSFWQYKVCADIRVGSVEKKHQLGSHVDARLEHRFLAFEKQLRKVKYR